jgi:hypothetical protein
VPVKSVVTFNVADLPWLLEKERLRAIEGRLAMIRAGLAAYDYALVQEDWLQKMPGLACGHWYWFPSGLTMRAPAEHPFRDAKCIRHRRAGWRKGDVLARKGWQRANSRGVLFAHTHLDADKRDREYREEQAGAIRDGLPKGVPLVLAGDFNTYAGELPWLDQLFAAVGLARVTTAAALATQKDHIYARGLTLVATGEDQGLSRLSDHPAIWASFEW